MYARSGAPWSCVNATTCYHWGERLPREPRDGQGGFIADPYVVFCRAAGEGSGIHLQNVLSEAEAERYPRDPAGVLAESREWTPRFLRVAAANAFWVRVLQHD